MLKGEERNRALSGGEVAKKANMHREESETDVQKETKTKDRLNADSFAVSIQSLPEASVMKNSERLK